MKSQLDYNLRRWLQVIWLRIPPSKREWFVGIAGVLFGAVVMWIAMLLTK